MGGERQDREDKGRSRDPPIQRKDILKYGGTKGCEGCRSITLYNRYGRHSEMCKLRFQEPWMEYNDPKFEGAIERHVAYETRTQESQQKEK